MKKMMLLIASLCIAHSGATTGVASPSLPAASVPPLMPVRDGVEILNAITRPYVTNTVHADARRRADSAAPPAPPSPAPLKPSAQAKPQSASAAREEAARVAAAAEEVRRVAAEQEAARKRAEERAEAMKKSLSAIAASLRLDSVTKQMNPTERAEQQQLLERAATAATATALGLDVDYAARMRKLRQAVRRCGGILTSVDVRVVEKLAGVTVSDKERWERGEWERRDHAKLLGVRLMLRKLLMDRLSEVQLVCVRSKMRRLAEARMDKASELMKPMWSTNLAKARAKYNISTQSDNNGGKDKETTRAGLLHPEKLQRKKDKEQREGVIGNLPDWIQKIRDTPRTPSARDNMRPIKADGLTDSAPAAISCSVGASTLAPALASANQSTHADANSAFRATSTAPQATTPTPTPIPVATTTTTTTTTNMAAAPHPYDQLSSYIRRYDASRDDKDDDDDDDEDDWMVPF